MRKENGFTLIELVIFIVVTSILASTLMLALVTALKSSPNVNKLMIATFTAEECMEWFIGQRRLNGFSSLTCPNTTVPSFCTAPSGYTLAVNISCTTINGDSNYKTITTTVSGSGNATLTLLIAGY